MICPECGKELSGIPVRFIIVGDSWRCRDCQDKITADRFRVLAIKDTDENGGKDITIAMVK